MNAKLNKLFTGTIPDRPILLTYCKQPVMYDLSTSDYYTMLQNIINQYCLIIVVIVEIIAFVNVRIKYSGFFFSL